jgi:hypothetical protein
MYAPYLVRSAINSCLLQKHENCQSVILLMIIKLSLYSPECIGLLV